MTKNKTKKTGLNSVQLLKYHPKASFSDQPEKKSHVVTAATVSDYTEGKSDPVGISNVSHGRQACRS